MDALRLIKTSRHAIAEARTVPDVLAEAWQAATLTEALAGWLGDHQDGEVAAVAQLLAAAGAHAAGRLEESAERPGRAEWCTPGRAARLSEVGEPVAVLRELQQLVSDAAEALMVIAHDCGTSGLFWVATDGLDATQECRDLVSELLRVFRRRARRASGVPLSPEEEAAEAEGVAPGRAAEGVGGELRLVLRLTPPSGPACGPAPGHQVMGPPAGSPAPRRSTARAPDASRSEPRSARSAVTEASNSCIWSSRLLGEDATPACAGATGASYLGSDMRVTLQLGSAV
ncbi:DUF6099 family protein [Streptomyces tateyamensis]|uniref:DUF6099 family protein n=1 Tax=Streptomyces tateyamensis TaxID=565073 RepID=UPI0015E8C824|nr:DUF6099 family protein [Streptomyces tateyamensis]